ncbi:MAG: T9SS type A sorting domain-containing protein [Saprospiraceae bacterium]
MKNVILIFLVALPFLVSGQELSLQLIGSSGAELATNNAKVQTAIGEIAINHYQGLTEGLLQGVERSSSQRHTQGPTLNLAMYPNPVSNQAFLQKDFPEAVQLHFYDESGRLLLKIPMASDRITVDCHDWPSGLYFIRIEHEEFGFNPIRFSKF